MPVNEMIRKHLRSLLWKDPLFETLKKEKDTLHIVIIGFDAAAEEFMRYSAELAVCHEAPVYTVLCTDKQKPAWEAMLKECPALPDLFEIDGKPAAYKEQAYGKITMQTVHRIDEKAIRSLFQEDQADYLFITGRNDDSALSRAEICASVDPNAVTAVSLRRRPALVPLKCKHFVPFYAEILDENDHVHEMLERIGKNIHFIWGGRETVRTSRKRVL